MAEIWVYKLDGTLQCGQGEEISLDAMAGDLAHIIGKDAIVRQEKRVLPHMIIAVCGAPTGNVNAYQITEEGAFLLFKGFPGPLGFSLWLDDGNCDQAGFSASRGGASAATAFQALMRNNTLDNAEVESAMAKLSYAISSAGQQPSLVTELVGRLIRFYKTGDSLTLDYIPRRVNVEVNSIQRIEKIWFG